MSTQPVPALTPEPKALPATTVPPLTDSYQKAHKSYVLFSALLASWQIIGITLETKDKWGITLKSPDAVPLVLVCLVVYFGYKMTIEWIQCEEARRNNVAATIDFRVAHALAVMALGITFIQYLLRIQIFDAISRRLTFENLAILGLMGAFTYQIATAATNAYLQLLANRRHLGKAVIESYKSPMNLRTIVFAVATGILLVLAVVVYKDGHLALSIAVLLGATIGLCPALIQFIRKMNHVELYITKFPE